MAERLYVYNAKPFIFDIDGHTLEYGREDFCLITGFRFGKVNLDPDEEDHSEFRMRVFPKIENLKGEHLLELVNKDVKFAKLDDEDVVRVCLLLALDFVFMGHELRHVVSKPIVNLVDDFYKWDAFPWGEYMWSFFHKRDYNVAVTRRKFHLEKLASNPKYEANYVLYGFVFPLKKSFVVDSPQFKVKDNEEACHSDFCLSTQQVRELINDFFHTPSVQVQDACVSELLDVVKDDVNVNSVVKEEIVKDDVNVNSLVKEDIEKDDVQFDSVVKDAEQIENETLPRQKFPGKAYLSPYIQPPSTEVKCRKRRREIKLEKVEKKVIKTVVGSDGVEIKLLPWKEDVTRSPTAPKRTVSVPGEVSALFRDKNRTEMKWTFPWCADGHLVYIDFWEKLVGRNHTKRGRLSTSHLNIWIDICGNSGNPMLTGQWQFANNVQKVYFPINEKDSHWVLGELHISSGLITIYDSLGYPPNGIETRLFWLDLREKLQFQIPLFLDDAEVFEKKNIVKDDYSVFNMRMASQSKVVFMVIVDYGFAYFYTGCHIIYLWRLMIPSVLHWHIVND
ncbi:phospholipase-like protein [Tanacetum coccineum]